jgi:hypothetical protein
MKVSKDAARNTGGEPGDAVIESSLRPVHRIGAVQPGRTNAACDPRRWRQPAAERDDLPWLFDDGPGTA